MDQEGGGPLDLPGHLLPYSPRLKTVAKIDIQLNLTARAQPVSPTKNMTSRRRIILTEKL